MKYIIALIGTARCGKDTAADFIAKNYNYEKINLSDLIAAEAKKRNLKTDKKSLSDLGNKFRREQGSNVMGKLVFKEIINSKKELFVISGFRTFSSIQFLRKRIPVFIVKIQAPFEERVKRATESKEELKKRDLEDMKKKGLSKTLKKSHKLIKNDSSLEKFYEKLRLLMQKLSI